MMTTKRIQKARHLSFSAHYGQKDKSGAPYFLHPLKVAEVQSSESEIIVALLHDVFEDTPLKIHQVDFLGEAERIALNTITKKPGQDYDSYISEIKQNHLARSVKIADIRHNLSDRGWQPPPERVAKYEKALKILVDG